MNKSYIRVWQEMDIKDIEGHLLIVGEVMGDCASCREVGLDYSSVTNCPKCKTEFKYISSREVTGAKHSRFSVVKRIKSRRPDLIFIDYDDFKSASGSSQARSIFND